MQSGDMVIVGGAERSERELILRKFIELAGGLDGRFLVLASATSEPLEGFARFRNWLELAGVPADRVSMLGVSKFVPTMTRGAWDPGEVSRIDEADGLWILGGDQNLTMSLLLDADGADSPLLAAIRRRASIAHRDGGLVIGGTSAGAAVLSDPMIGGGTSSGALSLPRATAAEDTEISPALLVLKGLGLFPEGIIDQHFDARARLARLAEAALVEDGARRPAFGIAEATALIYRGSDRSIGVCGAGGVYILDPRAAKRVDIATATGPRRMIRDLRLHYITTGDSYFPADDRLEFGTKEELSASAAAFSLDHPVASGILSPYGRLAEFAARLVLDNDPGRLWIDESNGRRYARSLLVDETPQPDGLAGTPGWEIRVGRYVSQSASGTNPVARLFYDGRYSFQNIYIDILPVDLEIYRPAYC